MDEMTTPITVVGLTRRAVGVMTDTTEIETITMIEEEEVCEILKSLIR